jgi:hypothetical protein
MAKFKAFDRSQGFLLPPDLREWVPDDDLAHFVLAAVERVEIAAFKDNLRGTGKAQYKRRKWTVEPVFGILKSVLGFTRFHLRGLANVKSEWQLPTRAYNCKRLHKLRPA